MKNLVFFAASVAFVASVFYLPEIIFKTLLISVNFIQSL